MRREVAGARLAIDGSDRRGGDGGHIGRGITVGRTGTQLVVRVVVVGGRLRAMVVVLVVVLVVVRMVRVLGRTSRAPGRGRVVDVVHGESMVECILQRSL